MYTSRTISTSAVGFRRLTPYMVVGGLFWVVMSLAAWRVPMCCDFGQHAAAVERIRADWLHPASPLLDLPGDSSPYYSPYVLVQGLIAKFAGLPGWQVVRACGPVNLLVLLTGIGRFTAMLAPGRRWAPVFALLSMSLLWGTKVAWWSGFLGLMSMTGNLPYPSTFAIGLTLHIWALAGSVAQNGARPLPYAGVGLLSGLTLLIHPITAVAAVAGVLALVAGRQRDWSRAAVGRWLLTAVAAIAVAAAWPYYDVFSLVGDPSIDAIHRKLYDGLRDRFWLALLGLPVLVVRWRRDRRDPLALMFALDCLVVCYGWASGHYTYGRILGLALLPLQFALAIELAAPRPWPAARRLLAPVAAAAALCGLYYVQAGAVLPRALDPVGFARPPHWPLYAWAADRMRPGDVVLTDGYKPTRALPAYGAFLVAPPWPDPSLPGAESKQRWEEVRAYLSPSATAATRRDIARRYQVRWLLLSRTQPLPAGAVVLTSNPRTGERLARVGSSPVDVERQVAARR